MAHIVLFTRPGCMYCEKAKELLITKVPVFYVIVLDEQADYTKAREEMVRLSDGATSVPQVFINGTHLPGGYTALLQGIEEVVAMPPTTTPFENKLGLTVKSIFRIAGEEMDF